MPAFNLFVRLLILQKETTKSEIIKRNVSINSVVKAFPVVFLATVGCIKYLDAEIAIRVMHFIQSIHPFKKSY